MYWAHSGLPTWVAHLGPISARRTLCFGSEVGNPSGAHKAVQMGPTWDPYRIPVGDASYYISHMNVWKFVLTLSVQGGSVLEVVLAWYVEINRF